MCVFLWKKGLWISWPKHIAVQFDLAVTGAVNCEKQWMSLIVLFKSTVGYSFPLLSRLKGPVR